VGLDWNPLGRPKAGHEQEFARLFRLLPSLPEKDGALDKLKEKWFGRDSPGTLRARWFEIQVSPLDVIGAPRVGSDSRADEWAKERYHRLKEPRPAMQQYLDQMKGYYVVALAPPCDGIPVYSNGSMGYVESYSFRAQFLVKDCAEELGRELVERCYESCLAGELADLAEEVWRRACSYAERHRVQHLESVNSPADFEEATPESKAHIMYSASKWCRYWAERGHGMEAYF
jgi:hypothetical protein